MVTLFVITAGLLALFVYTLATLSGMAPKRLYPLLRIKQADGRLTPFIVGGNFRGGAGRARPCASATRDATDHITKEGTMLTACT
jgi:hypothetical protein